MSCTRGLVVHVVENKTLVEDLTKEGVGTGRCGMSYNDIANQYTRRYDLNV